MNDEWRNEDSDDPGPDCSPGCRQGDHDADCEWYDWKYGKAELPDVPEDFPVAVLEPDDPAERLATCGTCERSWDDAVSTTWTPAPSGRCPFEYFH